MDPTSPTFTPGQIAVILRLSAPLLPDDRPGLFRGGKRRFDGVEIGDGAVFRACVAAQAKFRSLGVGIDG